MENDCFDKYHKTVFHIALGYVKNTHDADDIVQNVFLKLLNKLDAKPNAFSSEEVQKAWLIRVTINESKDLLKSAWFRKRNDLDESIAMPVNDDLGIYDYVKNLKPKYRTIVYLYYYQQYTIKEIASILKMPEATVGTHLYRARARLKEVLTKEDSYCGKQLQGNV